MEMGALWYLVMMISMAWTSMHAQEMPVINVAPQTTITIAIAHANAGLVNPTSTPTYLSTDQRIEQMTWLPTDQWKQKIIEFDAHQLRLYMQSLSKKQIDQDLNRFITSGDKQAFISQLTPDKQHLFHFMMTPESPSTASKSYRCLMAITSIAVTYLTLYARIDHLKKRISRTTSWALWHVDVPLEALREVPTEDLTTALRAAIVDKYSSTNNNHSVFHMLTTCLRDIEQELRDRIELRTIYQWITRFHLTAFVPKQYLSIPQIKEQEERLIFVKEIVNTCII